MRAHDGSSRDWRSALLPPGSQGRSPLALGVELRRRESAAQAHWSARRVTTARASDLEGDPRELRVGVRPLMRSTATGAWVRGDVSWDALRRGDSRFRAAHVQWFSELFGIARDVRILGGLADDSDWLTLDAVSSALLWPQLRAAAEAGIAIVPANTRQSVTLAVGASVTVDLAGNETGASEERGLHLSARVRIDGEGAETSVVRPIGRSGIYAAAASSPGIQIVLAPVALPETTRALLSQPGGVAIPPGEEDDFLREVYPRLARHGGLEVSKDLQLPAPEPSSILLTVAFGGKDTVEYRFEWLRPGEPPVAITEESSGEPAASDDDHEHAVRGAVELAWRETMEPAFAATGLLTGTDAAEFVSRLLPALEAEAHIRVESSGKRPEYSELTGDPRITVSTTPTDDPDWFGLGVIVEIDGRGIPFRPLFTALARGRKKLLLSDGRFFSLGHPALHRLRELIAEAADVTEWEAGPRISRYQLPVWEEFEDLAHHSAPARTWRAAASALSDLEHLETTTVPAGVRADLRPYQREGLDRLGLLWRHRLGGILADDMGLGKTLQLLALMAHARESGETRPFLVVAPTSVLTTWQDEARRFVPDLAVRLITETQAAGGVDVASVEADIVVTTYALLRLDEAQYTRREWAIVVLDEAQFVKNPRTRVYDAAARLRAGSVFAATGTPLENTLADLWALLSLTCPGLFPSARRFRQEYIRPIERPKSRDTPSGEDPSADAHRERLLVRLRQRMRPFVLRRTKQRVAPELPPRQEQEMRVELAPAHRAVYDTVLQRERQKVLGLLPDLDRNRFIVFRSLTLLRMLALAPALVDAGGADIPSRKIEMLLERIPELASEGHRALVFSQFTSYLAMVGAALEAQGIPYVHLDGSTRRRGEVIEQFRGGTAPVFLISLKAGGFGLTLTEADYVFVLDPWWNPAAQSQAVDRAHRIGQDRPVTVYRMIATGTIEEKVAALQQRKARLFDSVLGDDDALANQLTAEDIRDLLVS